MELRDRWNHLLPDAQPLGADLLARWGETHRAYHDVRHLTEVLDTVDELAGPAGLDATDADTVRLAAWFHDAIYDPEADPGENEEVSAQLAEAELAAYGLDEERVTEVGRLVRLTAAHVCADDDAAGTVLCDADLRILASDRARYDEYAAGIRREYAHVGDRDFARGRTAILDRIGRGRVYATPQARDAWEQAARDNLVREIAELRPATAGRWSGIVPLIYLGTAFGVIVAAAVLLGRAVAAAPSWPVAPGTDRSFAWWAPAAAAVVVAAVAATWWRVRRPRPLIALALVLVAAGAAGIVVCWARWPDPPEGVALSERWPYLLLAAIATLLGGAVLGIGARLRFAVMYSARPPLPAGLGTVLVGGALVGWIVVAAGVPFVQARLEAANTASEVAAGPPGAVPPARLDGSLAWTSELAGPTTVRGTAGGLARLRADGVMTMDATTGATRWSYARADVTAATGPGANGLVVSTDRRTLAVHLPAGSPRPTGIDLPTYAVLDAVTGAVLSEVRSSGTALAVDRDHLLVAEGSEVVDFAPGGSTRWRARMDCAADQASIVTGHAVVVTTCAETGDTAVRALDVTGGAPRWDLDLGEVSGVDPTARGSYAIGEMVAVPDSRRVMGLAWSGIGGGTLHQWSVDVSSGALSWSAPLPGSPRPRLGPAGCDPHLMANKDTVVVVACRTLTAPNEAQTYDVAAVNPPDGTPQWHHLLSVPPAIQDPGYPRRGFDLLADGRVVTLLPGDDGCTPVTIGAAGIQIRPFTTGDVPVPTVRCNRPQVTVATERPVLNDGRHLLALR